MTVNLTKIKPLSRAYAHRDCDFSPPLWQSLKHGFCHLEADVFCFAGRVLVAHDLPKLRPWKTLEHLYLEPLRNHLKTNNGKVFADSTPLWLFVDVKTGAQTSYDRLHKSLAEYDDIVTEFNHDKLEQRALTIIISGNRLPYETVAAKPLRFAALDGRLSDLGVHTDARVMPIISDHWGKHFSWRGEGQMPKAEREKLINMVELAHKNGQKLRFWATPDQPSNERTSLWATLLELGVDLINTDDLKGLQSFLG